MTLKYMDFLNQLPVVGENILTTFKQKELILINVQIYDGPITMQYLPYGGIQSIYGNHLIIKTLVGYIYVDEVIYDGVKMSTSQFIKLNNDLVNMVLPN